MILTLACTISMYKEKSYNYILVYYNIAIYFSERSNICPVRALNREITDTGEYGKWFCKHFKVFDNYITLHNSSMLLRTYILYHNTMKLLDLQGCDNCFISIIIINLVHNYYSLSYNFLCRHMLLQSKERLSKESSSDTVPSPQLRSHWLLDFQGISQDG